MNFSFSHFANLTIFSQDEPVTTNSRKEDETKDSKGEGEVPLKVSVHTSSFYFFYL